MRARNLKPSFFKNEELGSADPLFGIIFQGLWCLADREGRLEDRPLRIHVEVNPYRDSASTVQALDWLVSRRFVTRYEAGGVRYLEINNFARHQQPHIKEAPSKIPPPKKQELTEAPCEHRASTERAALIPDSPFLISDSPNPQSRAAPVPEDDEVVAAEKPATEKAPAAGDKPAPAASSAPAKPATPPTQPAAAMPQRPPAPVATPEPRRPSADEEARLRALIEGKASPARGDSYVLQIGAFSDAVKAARLVDDLRARGFPAYTERAGNVMRVRVGPVAGRAEADATAARLKAAGHPAVLQPR